jgi:hypothetical protein
MAGVFASSLLVPKIIKAGWVLAHRREMMMMYNSRFEVSHWFDQ